jgi:CBS domain-containing protein
MLKLRDIMTRDLITIAPDVSLRVAADALLGAHLSGAPVVAGREVVGVISLTDVLAFAASAPPPPSPRADERDWDAEVEAGPEDAADDESEADAFFTELYTGDADELVERFGTTDPQPPRDTLGEHTVADAMTHGVRALPPDATVEEAADLMRREGIHRVLVMHDGNLEGIVTTMDVAKAVADHRLLVRRFVFDRRRR